MTKLALQDVANLQNESTVVTQLKTNNTATTAALENTLSRDGTSPNQMLSNLDMNNYKVINLPNATTAQEPATYSQLTSGLTAVGNGAVVDAPYVTLGHNANLLSDRVLTSGHNVSVTDNGPVGTVVVDTSDPELNALAGVVSAADTVPYFTGSGTADVTTLSSYGRTLIDDVDAPTARATLGSVIGTDVQAHDNDLDALAGIATTGVLTRTGSGTATTRTVTGTANEITLTNGDGVAGNPTVSIPSAVTFTGKTVTGGTYSSPTLNSPTLVTPALGTPTSGVMTNVTGTAAGLTAGNVTTNANLTGPITSVGNATSIASQTGTGTKFVVDTSPTLVTPSLGVATATSVNKVAITAPATSATLTIANGKTLTANNSLTLAGVDATTQTFQASDTIVGRATTDILTNKSISGSTNTLSNIGNAALTNSAITIGSTSTSLGGTLSAVTGRGTAGLNIDQATGHGDSNYTILATDRHVFTNANFTASRTWTLPAANAVNAGQRILIGDLQGTITSGNTLVVAAAGADTINGLSTLVLTSASTSVELISDGTSKWYAVQSGAGGGGSGALSPPKSYEFVATAAQTSFTGTDQNGKILAYTPGGIQVFLKGRRLNLADYTATTGSTVVLGLPTSAGDLLTIVDYGSGNASSFVAYEYTATAGQTTFTGADANSKTLTYSPGLVLVYVNGDLLNSGDYTATSGSSIVLGVARAVSDQVKIIAMNQSAVGLVPANNLSDVSNATTARTNLGITPSAIGVYNSATAQYNPTNPSSFTSTTGIMLGLGGTVKITPNSSGRVLISYSVSAANSFATASVTSQIRYGTGAAPAFNAAATGTVPSGSFATTGWSAVANSVFPVSQTIFVTGLTVGTQYWFDLNSFVSTGTGAISNICFSLVEF